MNDSVRSFKAYFNPYCQSYEGGAFDNSVANSSEVFLGIIPVRGTLPTCNCFLRVPLSNLALTKDNIGVG